MGDNYDTARRLCELTGPALVDRCKRHAAKMDGEGRYTTANTLDAAAVELERLRTALRDLASEVQTHRLHSRWRHLSNERTNMLSAYLLAADKVLT